MRALLVLLLALDANAPPAGLDPANLGLLRTIAPLGGELNGVAFSGDGRLFAVGCGQGARVYETGTWRPVARLEGHPDHVQGIAFSPDGRTLAAGGAEGTVVLWQVPGGKVLHTLRYHAAHVFALAFSPDGATIVTGSHDGRARAWDTADGRARADFDGGKGAVWCAAYSRDGSRVAVGGEGEGVRIYRTDGWTLERLAKGSQVGALAFSGDGRRLMGHGPFGAQVWDAATGIESRKAGIPAGAGSATRFTPDERFVVGWQGTAIGLWDLGLARETAKLAHHTGAVTGVAVHPGGRMIASIGQDRHLKVWGPVPGGMARVRPRGFLGVTVTDSAGGRVMISQVYEKSAAESAGLRQGDLLLKVAGQALENMTQAVDQIGSFREEDEVEFEIDRGGDVKSMKVRLGKRPVNMPN